jgi:hypothetical protein
MPRRAIRFALVVAFAVVVGHLAWGIFAAPASPEYLVGGETMLLTGTDPAARNLYLRRTIYMPQHPDHAWIQALAYDELRLYVNGHLVQGSRLEGFPVAVLADLTPYLHRGVNGIALVARQATLNRPPAVAVEGGLWFADGEHSFGADDQWRCSHTFERRGRWWFEKDFDDKPWPKAIVKQGYLRARVRQPPQAIRTREQGRWITPPALAQDRASLHRDLDLSERPRSCWLRVTAWGAYRLGINGILLDEQEDQLGVSYIAPPVQRTYDLTPFVRRGANELGMVLTGTAGMPHVRADIGIEDSTGLRILGSDERWTSRPGGQPDWLHAGEIGQLRKPCLVESGDLDVVPWQVRRDFVETSLPAELQLRRIFGEVLLMAIVALAAALACWLAARQIGRFQRTLAYPVEPVSLALVLPTLALAGAMLAVYDPRVARQDVYRPLWLVMGIVAVLGQWVLLALLWRGQSARPIQPAVRRWQWLLPAIVGSLMMIGFLLRWPGIHSEALHWDEVENIEAARGIWERGFPSRDVHPDVPIAYVHTSELFFYPPALASLIFDDERLMIRLPGVLFSTLTIGLIFLAGRGMFNVRVGLVAAALLAFSPMCIAMSSFGRYFAQLQFFAVLTVYAYWLTVRGQGPINWRALWLTAVSFIAMFLTWEAAALMAPAMMIAALIHRRKNLRTILLRGSIWAAMLVVGLAVLLQYSHVVLQQTRFLWYGTSHSDVSLKPMWRYPFFQPWYYVWQSSWSQDGLLPMLGLAGACLLALRHRFRRPVRFLLIIHVGTCLMMSLTLTASAWRYIHHQIPFLILLASAAVVALAEAIPRLAHRLPTGRFVPRYAGAVAILFSLGLVALGSGQFLRLPELTGFRIEGYTPEVFRFPDLERPARYVCQHWRPGDVVMATDPFQVNALMAQVGHTECPATYWPASNLRHPATLDNRRSLPLDRRDGTPMIPDWESLGDLFARHDRVWYIVQPIRHWDQNVPEVTAYLLQHMEVAYEDAEALVLVRDNHRTAEARRRDEIALRAAQARILP